MNCGFTSIKSHIIVFNSFLLILSLTMPAVGFAQDPLSMPAGEGRELVSSKCVSCHGMSTVLVKRASLEVWDETVTRMVGVYNAPVNNNEQTLIVNYLATHFGEDSSVDVGQQTVAEQCFRCHADGMWHDLRTDRNGWLSVIYRMLGRGGLWSEDQINVMADYLTATYPEGEN